MNKRPARDSVDASLQLEIGGEPQNFQFRVPRTRTSAQCVIPFARSVTNATVDVAEQAALADGKAVSCRKGCGACCRQLVPVSPTEARYLVKYIAGLSPGRRDKVYARFEALEQALKSAGLWETLMRPEQFPTESIRAFGLDYFDLGQACPFLEDEACSIHKERPLSCREFLATTPASHCASPRTETIETVEVPVKFSKAMGRIDQGTRQYQSEWVALSTIIAWVRQHPEPPASKTGPKWIERLLDQLDTSAESDASDSPAKLD